MKTENNFEIEQFIVGLKNKLFSIDFQFFIHQMVLLLKLIIVLPIVFIVLSYLRDYFKKDKYKIKLSYRTPANTIGGGEEYYETYWTWQKNKKKQIVFALQSKLGHNNLYERKARKRKLYVKCKVPFRKEIYGKIR